MAYGNFQFTYTLVKLTQRVAARLKTSRETLFNGLNVESAGDAENLYIDIVNEAQRDFMNKLPISGEFVIDPIAIVPATVLYDLPVTPIPMFRMAAVDLIVAPDDQYYPNAPIKYVPRHQWRRMGPAIFTIAPYVPLSWTITEDGTQMELSPFSGTMNLTGIYRGQPDTFTVEDLVPAEEPEDEKKFVVPDDWIEAMETLVAHKVAKFTGMDEEAAMLQQALYGRQSADEPGLIRKLQEEYGEVEAGFFGSRSFGPSAASVGRSGRLGGILG